MSVLVLNTLSKYDDKILELQKLICEKAAGSEVVYTKDMKISHCIGCNYCWLKTPGICTIKDDYEIILKKILQHKRIGRRIQKALFYYIAKKNGCKKPLDDKPYEVK